MAQASAVASVGLSYCQQPHEALVTVAGKEKSRKPIDPPPMVQVTLDKNQDPNQNFFRSPHAFGVLTLYHADKDEPYQHNRQNGLTGTLVSSLHCLKNIDNKEGGFFIFGDVSVKVVGRFRLRFTLHELIGNEALYLGEVISEPFEVSQAKDFKGLRESTYLSRAFSDQGVRLRLRKDTRGAGSTKRSHQEEEHEDVNDAKRLQKGAPYSHSLSVIPVINPRMSINMSPNTTSSMPPSYSSVMAPRMPTMPSHTNSYSMTSGMPANTNSYMHPSMSANTNSYMSQSMPTNTSPYVSSNMPSNMPSNMGPGMPSNMPSNMPHSTGPLPYGSHWNFQSQ
jgi:hypothetical protein|tara:strand:+ start:19490 stop:20500 length:1011 start_codon:yes stop_codon:yes gene_type:complete